MRKIVLAGLTALLFVLVSAMAYAGPPRVTVPLPPLIITAPPALVVIPGTYVYAAPEIESDIFFYQGKWYRMYEGQWYVAHRYSGPWKFVRMRKVPKALTALPPDYRAGYTDRERLRHDDVKKHWRAWERKRQWDERGPEPAPGLMQPQQHRGEMSPGMMPPPPRP